MPERTVVSLAVVLEYGSAASGQEIAAGDELAP